VKEALVWSAVWIALALLFNVGVYFRLGAQAATEFLTGYIIEKSLSVDNIFVFLLIFTAFRVPAIYQHRVLYFGVFGALVMRGILIFIGATLIEQFHWVIYIFGAFLILTGIRMAIERHQELHPEENPIVQIVGRLIPISAEYRGQRFFLREAGRWLATPLMLVLIVVEFTDLVFAVDSIPAIFAVTQDPFIVYTSNVFAILGLRSLYFALSGLVEKFHYLKLGLSAVLVFVGLKMIFADVYKIPIGLSLGLIVAILATALIASLVRARALSAHIGSDGGAG
jgi:tellurite resistance protein TerC